MRSRRDFITAVGKAGGAAAAFLVLPTTAFAGESLEQKCRRLLESVAPLRAFTFERQDDAYYVAASWGSIEDQTVGEFSGCVPVADTSTITVFTLVLPEKLRGQGIPEQLYTAWGGKAKSAFPTDRFPFLNA